MRYSACIEWLFADAAPDFPGRIRAARAAGLEAVEFWHWRNKDLDGIAAALAETGLPLAAMVAEPMIALTDPANHEDFLAGLADSIATAQRLGCPVLIAQTGDDLPGRSRSDQRAALVSVLRRAADLLTGTGVRLGIEPLNTRVDHPGYYLWDTAEGLDILDEVDRPEIGMTYDLYHSGVMDEAAPAVIGDRIHRIIHLHVADHPGRGAPGTGTLDLPAWLNWLEDRGYRGFVGLEYRPEGATAAPLPRATARAPDTTEGIR